MNKKKIIFGLSALLVGCYNLIANLIILGKRVSSPIVYESNFLYVLLAFVNIGIMHIGFMFIMWGAYVE